jgi:molybdate transport system permease protein
MIFKEDIKMTEPILLSLQVALIAVAIVAVLATLLARLMARQDFTGKALVESLIILPMVLPPTVIGYGLLILLGKRGLLGRFLFENFDLQIVFTWWAAIFAAAVVSFPLMYQSAKAAFASVDLSLEQAARTLGSSEIRVFLRITLPLAYPGLLAGLVLAFARALGEFGATLMVAGNIPGKTQTIPLAIYFAVETGDNILARNLVLVITGLSITALFWLNLWSRKKIQVWQKGGAHRAEGVHS